MNLNDLLRLDLQFFAEEEGGIDENHGNEPEINENNDESNVKTFTQDELNELITKRLERERKKYADYEDIKARLAEYEKQIEEQKRAEMSELERLQADLKAKEEAEQTLAKQLEELRANVQRERITNAFIKAAPSVNIPADRIDAALKLADLSAVTVDEEGNVNGLEDVLKSLVEQYIFLAEVKKPQKPIGESTNGNPERADKTAEQLLKEAAERAKRTNKQEDIAKYLKLKRELGL
jgi:SMC interacting uncharacterized protein involved in chromosome segregation